MTSMKKTLLLVIIYPFLISCGTSTQKKDEIQKVEAATSTPSKKNWTAEQRENFIKTNAKSVIDSFILQRTIAIYEFEKNDSTLRAYIQSSEFEKDKKSIAKQFPINIDAIAAQKADAVEILLGKPTRKEDIAPSGVGSCQKFTYLNGLVEVVYIDSKADWITVNNTPSKSIIKEAATYQSVQQFSDFTYVKVNTK